MSDTDSGAEVGAFFAGIVIGGLVGAATALLLAPQSGEETRAQLGRNTEDFRDRAQDYLGDARERAEATVADARRRAERIMEDARINAEKISEDAKKKANTLAAQAKDSAQKIAKTEEPKLQS